MYRVDDILNKSHVAIYGMGKFQQDFEYIFDFFDIQYYIIDEVSDIKEINDKPLYNIEDIRSKEIEEFIIVCEFNKEKAKLNLEKLNLCYGENFVYAEDIFDILDRSRKSIFDIIDNRKIAIWGTGDAQFNFEQQIQRFDINVDIDIYIDSDLRKSEHVHNERLIKHPNQIKNNIKDFFVIVASTYYDDIKLILFDLGLFEGRDFIKSGDFLHNARIKKPSEMLIETIYAEPINGPNCLHPFETINIYDRDIYCCCGSWLKYFIGDLCEDELDDIWNSYAAKIYRLSMINKTYSFCKQNVCPLFDINISKSDIRLENIPPEIKYPKELGIAIDYSCNLYCSSCRNQIATAKGSDLENKIVLADKIISSNWLENVETLTLAGNGEVFLSKVYEKILYSDRASKRNDINILTNGTLFTIEKFNKLKNIYKNIYMRISIDAATNETYKVLRRGGNWEVLINNLEIISELRKNDEISNVQIDMVVQKQNYKEMINFVKMAQRFSFDEVLFTRIVNWGTYSNEEFETISMISGDNTIKPELVEILKNPIFKEKIVNIEQFKYYL